MLLISPARIRGVLTLLISATLLATPAQEAAAKETKSKSTESKSTETKTTKSKVRYAHLTLAGEMPEAPGGSGPFAELQPGLAKTIAKLDKAAEDDTIQGLVLDIQNPAIGRGAVDELRAAIKRFRASGKKVHAQLELATPTDYLVACACDEVVMPESGMLVLPGVRAEGMFMKGLLAKVGVEADFIHMGEAKGAAESYTRDRWSEPVKKNLTAMIDDLYTQLFENIGLDRPVTEKQARELIDRGILTAGQAKQAGLVDRLAYPDEVRASIAKSHPDHRLVYVENYGAKQVDTDFSGPAGFFKLMGMLAGAKTDGAVKGKKIAVVYAVGPIMSGESEQDLFGGSSTIGSTTLVAALDQAHRDQDVAAIVLRVNSPGGSAIASDLIWRKTQQIDKPIVVSMGDVAASGGYYISMGADHVFAEPQTVTGSIGVVGGKMALSGMYKKLGLSIDTISRGKASGIFSSTDKFTDPERKAITSMMEDTYKQFTSKAAEGRNMKHEDLLGLASGKVYTGRQALRLGLVDELGSLKDALAKAKELAGIPAEDKVRLMTLPKEKDLFEELFGGGNKQPTEVRLSLEGLALPEELHSVLGRLQAWKRVLDRERVGLFMPVDIVIH